MTEQDNNMPALIFMSKHDNKAMVSAFCKTLNNYDTQMLLLMIKQRTFGVDWFIDCVEIVCNAASVNEWRDDLLESFLSDRESSIFLSHNLATIENFISYDAQRAGIEKGEWLQRAHAWLPRNAKGEIIIRNSVVLSEDLLASLTKEGCTRFDNGDNYEDMIYDAAIVRAVLESLCEKFITFAKSASNIMNNQDGSYQSGYDAGYAQARKDMLDGILE